MRTAALSGAVILSTLSIAHASGPFDALTGRWSGSGRINFDDGSGERLRCNANYSVSGDQLRLDLTCASDSYKIEAHSNVRYNSGFISGNWNESTRNLGGEVSGSAGGNTIRANLESGGSTLLSMTVVTNGAAQSIRIAPQQGTGIKSVQINMTRK